MSFVRILYVCENPDIHPAKNDHFECSFRYMMVDDEEDVKTHKPITPKAVRCYMESDQIHEHFPTPFDKRKDREITNY